MLNEGESSSPTMATFRHFVGFIFSEIVGQCFPAQYPGPELIPDQDNIPYISVCFFFLCVMEIDSL